MLENPKTVPNEFGCSILRQIMNNPVKASAIRSFKRKAIKDGEITKGVESEQSLG